MGKPDRKPVHITTHRDGAATILVDGVDISQKVMRASLELDNPNITLVVEYACHDQLTFDGEAEIVHVCPKKAR